MFAEMEGKVLVRGYTGIGKELQQRRQVAVHVELILFNGVGIDRAKSGQFDRRHEMHEVI